MWKIKNRLEYREVVSDLIDTDAINKLKNVTHHSPSLNCYDHSLFVSYLSYRICKRLGWDSKSAARGGLLHDFYLYDQHEEKHKKGHLRKHAKIALENAQSLFELNEKEKDCIEKHMWPITFHRPRFKESLVVCLVDNICAIAEVLHIYHLTNVGENMELVAQPF